MTALAKQSEVQGNNQAGVSGGPVGENMDKITIGAAALSAKAIYEIMAMYAEIIKLNQEEKVSMVKAQEAEGRGQADATEKAGKEAMMGAVIAGALTIVGALSAMGLSIGMTKVGDAGRANKEMATVGKEIEPMKTINTSVENGGVGGGTPTKESQENVDSLVKEFKAGNYSNAKNNDDTKQAVKDLINKGSNAENSFNFDKWKDEFNTSYERKLKEYNTASNIYTARQTFANTANGFVTTTGQSGGSAVNGVYQSRKAQQDAISSLDGNANQMAGNSASEFGQAANKAFDSQNSEVRVLAEMNQANGMNA